MFAFKYLWGDNSLLMESHVEQIGDSKSFDYLPSYFASVVTTNEQKKQYEDWFVPHLSNTTLKQNIEIGLADIDARIAWRKRDEPKIKKYLQEIQ